MGDDLASLIAASVREAKLDVADRDVFVIAQKVVSKAEGRTVDLNSILPSPRARQWAEAYAKDPRVVEVVLAQSRSIIRMEQGVIISETEHGFICANAGVDASKISRRQPCPSRPRETTPAAQQHAKWRSFPSCRNKRGTNLHRQSS